MVWLVKRKVLFEGYDVIVKRTFLESILSIFQGCKHLTVSCSNLCYIASRSTELSTPLQFCLHTTAFILL